MTSLAATEPMRAPRRDPIATAAARGGAAFDLGVRAYLWGYPPVITARTRDFAKQHGHVETLFGRRIHTPEINSKGPHGGFAYRAAINAPIQGSAADVIRRAMIRVPDAIRGLPARMRGRAGPPSPATS